MKTIEAIYKAIRKINPNAEVSMSGDDISAIDTITWENGTQPINKQQILDDLSKQYSIAGVIDLDSVNFSLLTFTPWIKNQLTNIRKECYENNERLVIFLETDYYQERSDLGLKLKTWFLGRSA